jgi:fucose 4-O-acetylase-like acetyltransferase
MGMEHIAVRTRMENSKNLEGNMMEEKYSELPQNRIEYLDIAKGIGIILVVLAHARVPQSTYIYQFHMPFFFLISGLLYNTSTNLKDYIFRKIKSLYIPFVFWNLFFVLSKGIIRGSGAKVLIKSSIEIILTLSKDGEFLGATWFLGSLFVIAILYKIIDIVIPESDIKPFLIVGLFTCFAIIGFQITFKYMISRTLILGLFYAAGAFVKSHKHYFAGGSFGLAIICFVTFWLIGRHNSANMGKNEYTYPVLFVIGAFMASYAVIYFCMWLEKIQNNYISVLKKILIHLGKRSIDIVIWQFVFFRVGIIAQIYLNHEELSISNILSYYPLYSEARGWWIIYTIIGILLPLIWCDFLRIGPWGYVLKKLCIV